MAIAARLSGWDNRRPVLSPTVRKLANAAVLAATVSVAAPLPEGAKPLSAYHDNSSIQFLPEVAGRAREAALGPWAFGSRLVEDKPLDKRLNLYVVLPGTQYQSGAYPEYDHNLVVNTLTHDKARGFDIFWCFILDPTLADDLRSERDLLLAAQQTFIPADLYDLEDIPGHEVLSEKTGITDLADLDRYRRKGGTLPRLLILPAHLAVSAQAEETADPAPGQTGQH